ncbi:hypothetical protein G7025_16360 [Pseudomonas lurida]|uniref:hypothetical protein n=1 Tax=Pseudomonas TaxID=286 RepID=UPI0015E413D9|nr:MULTISPECIES: hypothetical protein [Pseudomonas]MBA1294931.1 hypothetical protein [Pseudomonas lurida]
MTYKIAMGTLAVLVFAGSVHAADIKDCPEKNSIKSEKFHDASLPGAYGDGFKYTATSNGKTWTGQTSGTEDDYLADKYALKVETFGVVDGKLRCDYGGKRLVENGKVSDPHLRLSTPQ